MIPVRVPGAVGVEVAALRGLVRTLEHEFVGPLDDDAFARRARLGLDIEDFEDRYDAAVESARAGSATDAAGARRRVELALPRIKAQPASRIELLGELLEDSAHNKLSFTLEAGESLWLNNHACAHSRDAFEDGRGGSGAGA